jgi:hypothetical protein
MAVWPNIIDDDGSGTTGTVLNDALFDAIKAYIDASVGGAAGGVWVDVPYSAANFGASGGTWTVTGANAKRYSYMLLGKTAFVQIYVDTSTVGGTPTSLNVVFPFNVLSVQSGWGYFFSATVHGHVVYQQPSLDPYLRFSRDGYNTPFVAELTNLRASLVLQLA